MLKAARADAFPRPSNRQRSTFFASCVARAEFNNIYLLVWPVRHPSSQHRVSPARRPCRSRQQPGEQSEYGGSSRSGVPAFNIGVRSSSSSSWTPPVSRRFAGSTVHFEYRRIIGGAPLSSSANSSQCACRLSIVDGKFGTVTTASIIGRRAPVRSSMPHAALE